MLGRVNEFLDVRNLEPEGVEDADIWAAVVRGYTAFHAIKIQLEENPVQVYSDIITKQLKKYYKIAKLKKLAYKGGVNVDDLIDYDFISKIRYITERLESTGGGKRMVYLRRIIGECDSKEQPLNKEKSRSPL